MVHPYKFWCHWYSLATSVGADASTVASATNTGPLQDLAWHQRRYFHHSHRAVLRRKQRCVKETLVQDSEAETSNI